MVSRHLRVLLSVTLHILSLSSSSSAVRISSRTVPCLVHSPRSESLPQPIYSVPIVRRHSAQSLRKRSANAVEDFAIRQAAVLINKYPDLSRGSPEGSGSPSNSRLRERDTAIVFPIWHWPPSACDVYYTHAQHSYLINPNSKALYNFDAKTA